MVSEWEELEKLTKEELIIELMKERTSHRELERSIRGLIDVDYPADKTLPVFADMDEPGLGSASEDWLYRIAMYAYDKSADKDRFSYNDLEDYGLSSDMAEEAYRLLRVKGIITDDSKDLQGWF